MVMNPKKPKLGESSLRGLLILGLVIFMSLGSPLLHAKDNDFQVWNSITLRYGVPDTKIALVWHAENRLQNDGSDFLLFLNDLGFLYSIVKWFSIGPILRLQKPNNGDLVFVPYPEFNFIVPLGPINFLSRNRFQFFISNNPLEFQYRNLIRFSHTFTKTPVYFTPFIWDEVFLGTRGSPISQNRLVAGNGFGFLEGKITLNLFYMFQTVRLAGIAGFQKRHIFGTNIFLNF